jgi:hypothetical protein
MTCLPRNLLVLLTLVASVATCPAATVAWKANRTGDWADASNWEPGRLPAADDDVVITAPGTKVLLSRPTPALRSVTLTGVLTFAGWDTKLTTVALTVKSGGLITHEGP